MSKIAFFIVLKPHLNCGLNLEFGANCVVFRSCGFKSDQNCSAWQMFLFRATQKENNNGRVICGYWELIPDCEIWVGAS